MIGQSQSPREEVMEKESDSSSEARRFNSGKSNSTESEGYLSGYV